MYVSAETGTYKPWGSETPVECMLVKEETASDYSPLAFDGIKGFDYVRGHEYELKVRKTTLLQHEGCRRRVPRQDRYA